MNIILFEPNETERPLPGRDARAIHLLKILRKKEGDAFDAGVLGIGVGEGRLGKADANGLLAFTLEMRSPPPPRLPIRVAVGFPRPIQLRRLLRELSGMGVAEIDLVCTDLGEKSYRDTRLLEDGGARAALIEGAAQSRDATLPNLKVHYGIEKWLSEIAETGGKTLRIAADNVRPAGTLSGAADGNESAVLAIGPERGWSDRERGILETAGFVRLSMGSRALRTETACVAAVALTLEKIGVPE